MRDGYCKAIWRGPSAVRMGSLDGAPLLQPGDEHEVPETEAEESLNWEPVKAEKPAPKPKPAADAAEED